MFNFFKKNKPAVSKTLEVHAVASGDLVAITDVNDVVFAQKMMGDGFAIVPSDGTITSPVSGTITSIFPSQHAIGITTPNGLEVLVHMGINTVELNGNGFKTMVEQGQEVTPETTLSVMDLDVLRSEEKDTSVMVIFTNMDAVEAIDVKPGTVTVKDVVGQVTAK